MKDLDAQMTHRDEEGTMNAAVTKLSEASFAEDWNCDEDQVYDATTAKERELLLQDCRVQLGRVWPVVSSSEKFAMSNTIPRLIADVEALTAERAERHLDLEDVCLQVNARNAEVSELRDLMAALLRKRGDSGEQPGICYTDVGQHCPFCTWNSEDFESLALHDEDCPFGKLSKMLQSNA